MLRLLADENFNGRILRALQRRIPDLDVVRAQDTPFSGTDDESLLGYAAAENRILLSHDVSTLVGYAWERVRLGKSMPGVIAMQADQPLGPVIEDLEVLLLASSPEEIQGQVVFVPL